MTRRDGSSGAKQVEQLAKFLDAKFEVGPLKFGWDSILGLIPGVGDTAASLASTFIIYQAYNHGMSKATLARMTLNVAIDSVLGSIPFLGDIIDVFWKSNRKNAQLFERELKNPRRSQTLSGAWLLLIFLIVVGSLFMAIYLPIKLIQAII